MTFAKIIGGLFYFYNYLISFLMYRVLITTMAFLNTNIDVDIPTAHNVKNIIVLINTWSFKFIRHL